MSRTVLPHAFLILTALAGPAWGDVLPPPQSTPAQETELPYMGSPAPAELQVLAPLLGDWSIATRVQTAESPGRELRFAGKARARLAYNGQFIQLDGSASDGKEREEYVVLYRYDSARRVYRRWYFSSIGLASEFVGRWDGATKTMTWTLLNPSPGRTGVLTDTLRPDGFSTDVVYRDDTGKVTRHAVLTAARLGSPAPN
ncbi:DUF1579 family protein [Sphingomonas sp. IBVSS2]|uniref:DUF1579 family protein n=1 Tax=Sphingomonas sp. IBVSS2 TaxID=1985172 RepID=UPI001181B1D6|nr:DUF1579 family protein [Sphingomonas sp. IBVSS2]